MSRSRVIAAMLLVAASSGCAGAAMTGTRSVGDAERMRATLTGKDTQSLAPQAFAAANQELTLAKQAHAAGDETGADLHAEHALGLFNQAALVARLARATREESSANEALARGTEEGQRYGAQRKAIDHEA